MIAIVDYNAGNLTSVELALRELGEKCMITQDRSEILSADRVIFPGVGAAGSCMQNITERELGDILKEYLMLGKPFLGICVGAQIILESSLENEGTKCLGFLPGTTGMFHSTEKVPIKIPQIGWNQVEVVKQHPLFAGVPNQTEFYFVHSYYPLPENQDHKFAQTVYGDTEFASVIGRDNLIACQFHPEKSGRWGLKLLKNFCEWTV